jgi:hypothetical protein
MPVCKEILLSASLLPVCDNYGGPAGLTLATLWCDLEYDRQSTLLRQKNARPRYVALLLSAAAGELTIYKFCC